MPSTRSNTPKSKASSALSSRNSSAHSKHSSPPKSAKSSPRRASPQATPRSTGSKTNGAAKPSRGSAPPSASGPMMISSQQQKEDVRAAKKMLEDPHAAKMVLSGDNLDLYKSLKDTNSKLLVRLTELNSGLDQQLSKQNRTGGGSKATSGHNASTPEKRFQYTADDSPPPLTKADRLAAKNLEMKREITNLNRALKEQQAGSGAIFELRNKASALKKDLEEVQSENKSLENVYGNQNIKTSKHDKGEQQLNDIRREHGDQVRETKELVKQFKDLREIEMGRTRTLLKVETQLLEKAKFLSQHGFGVKRRKTTVAASKPSEVKSEAKREKKATKEKKEKKVRRSSSNGSSKSGGSRSPVSSRSSSVSSTSTGKSSRSSISNKNNNDIAVSDAGDDVGGNGDGEDGAEPTLTNDLVLKCFPYLVEDSESIAAPFNPKVLHAYLSRLVVEEEELQEKIQSTAVQAVRDRHRTRTQGPKLLQEMDDLREELKLLKEKQEALEMAKSVAN